MSYKGIISVRLFESPMKSKKYRAIFYDNEKVIKHTDFGYKNMEDYTTHHDKQRKNNFLSRFATLIKENETDPSSAMTLSKWVLWNKKSLQKSWDDYKRHFNLQ
jgi:hypothetical protein